MQAHFRRITAVFAIALVALLGAGCNKSRPQQQTGVARIVARLLTIDPAIARVTVKVSQGQGSAFNPITVDLAVSGPVWLGRVADIPAGTRRQFDVAAYDSAGNALYTGSAQSDIVGGQVAVVSITIQKAMPPPISNSFPVIDSLAWSSDQMLPSEVVQLIATAHDPDVGDTITYRWLADCGTFDDATRPAPRWTAPAVEGVCHLSLDVTDNHGATTNAAFSLTVTRNLGDAVVVVTLNSWPIISGVSGTIRIGATMDGDLAAQAIDPDGDPLSYTWTSDCPGLVFNVSAPYAPATPHFTLPLPAASCRVVLTVSDGKVPAGTGTIATLYLPPGNFSRLCVGVTCLSGQACNPADAQCVGNCVPACTGKACGNDGCGGTCGTCASGQVCNASGQCGAACTPSCTGLVCGGDGCGGTCGPGCSSGQTCNAGGQCVAACTPNCAGKVCGSDGCGGTCGSGCTTGQTCDATGQCVSCTPACTGKTCGSDGCGGTCGPGCTTGQTCDATGVCVATCTPSCTGKTCGPDGCGGTCAPGCTTGQTCDATGVCVAATTATDVIPQVARDLLLAPPAGLAMDTSGNTYVTGNLSANVPTDFSGISVPPTAGSDAFVAKYDPAGTIQWAATIGDDGGATTNQTATKVAITKNGRMAIVGKFGGTMTFGSNTLSSASQISYLGVLDGNTAALGTPSRLWGKQVNLGASGDLKSVASNPNDSSNRIAVCGLTQAAATNLVTGATFGGATDIVVGVFDSAGNKLWSTQLGGTGNENCQSVAIDDHGDVVAVGQFDGASLTFPGATPVTLTGPGTSARKFMWVAKFSGAGNAALTHPADAAAAPDVLAAVAYSGTTGAALPNSVAVAPGSGLFVAGQFTGNLTIGSAITTAGQDDAFAAKLDGTTLAPSWSSPFQLGGTGIDLVRCVAVDSNGDPILNGQFNSTSPTTKGPSLTSVGSNDVFLLKLSGSTGAVQYAHSYGDVAGQTGDQIVVNRFGTNQTTFGTSISSSANFGGAVGSVTAAGTTDAFLIFSKLQ
jgi:hypothetical protein